MTGTDDHIDNLEAHEQNDTSELLAVALEAALGAAELVRTRRAELIASGALVGTAETKSSDVDPVTVVDKESEEHITRTLKELRPTDGIVGEEGTSLESESGVRWIVDPIDGTVNFLYGIPQYAISIAAAAGEKLIAAVVINVATGRTYIARAGEGAYVEDDEGWHQLTCSPQEKGTVAHALVATGFSYIPEWRAQQAQIITNLLPQVRDIRRMGSAALDLCALAEGTVNAYYEHGIHPWDYAAGALIAAEAGARVHHPGLSASGKDGELTAAAAPGVWEEFREVLAAAGAFDSLR